MCVCGRIFWEDRREEEKKEGADTALKTKNPHVNVGKKYHYMGIFFKNSQNTIKILYKEL